MKTRLSLQEIFVARLPEFLKTRRLPLVMYKAAKAILHCRTPVLGGHVMACPQGHGEKLFFHSCGHRACPKCAYAKTEQWLEGKRQKLLACKHIHFTFMLPSEFYPFWPYNTQIMAELLFQSVRDTLFELLVDPEHLGALPGFYMALHSWNRLLGICPHLHVLSTIGGLAEDGTWKNPRRKSLLSTDDPKRVFRRRFCDGFKKLLDQGKLHLPPDINENEATVRCLKARCHRWIVHRGQPTNVGENILTYFARYGRGGPMGESRLLDFDGASVTFRKSRYHEPFESVTLPADVFIERLLRHVPPFNFRTLRSYGLYAPNASEKRQRARAALGQPEPADLQAEPGAQAPGEQDHDRCDVCGCKLVLVGKMPRPPPRPAPRRVSSRRSGA